jgi:hypothetical protein
MAIHVLRYDICVTPLSDTPGHAVYAIVLIDQRIAGGDVQSLFQGVEVYVR